LKGFDEETLRKIQNSSKDELGITHANTLYNKEDRFFCLLNASSKEAVVKHHEKHHEKQ